MKNLQEFEALRTFRVARYFHRLASFFGVSVMIIPLTQGKSTVIDDDDWFLVKDYKWYVMKNHDTFYAASHTRKPNGIWTTTYMHRLLMGNPNSQVDHRNGNGLYNRRSNLRLCTNQENSYNRHTVRGSSIYKGVCWHKRDKKWESHISVNRKRKFLGYFNNEVEAAKAYDTAATELYGEFARTNF